LWNLVTHHPAGQISHSLSETEQPSVQQIHDDDIRRSSKGMHLLLTQTTLPRPSLAKTDF